MHCVPKLVLVKYHRKSVMSFPLETFGMQNTVNASRGVKWTLMEGSGVRNKISYELVSVSVTISTPNVYNKVIQWRETNGVFSKKLAWAVDAVRILNFDRTLTLTQFISFKFGKR
mmetsp:Transcript_5837/g.14158  ORF Transcript_5837/g.14158 Transcript_5837/m.14158 type:complete len:115 (-) Transcript_5837:252-596(-)